MVQIELDLTSLAYGGESLGRDNSGRVVFVPFGIPGERVRAEITEQGKRWARGRLLEVLRPSPDRVDPRCRHFTQCGGCHYQHLPYARQLAFKAAIVRDQLERLAGLSDPPVEATVPSPSPWNTRNHLRFHLDPQGRLGFVPAGQGENEPGDLPAAAAERGSARTGRRSVLAIEECHLPEPALSEIWPRLEVEAIPTLQQVSIRCGAGGEAAVILHGSRAPQAEITTDVPCSILWDGPDELEVLVGSLYLWYEVHGLTFRVSAPAFFQVHSALSAALVDLVLEAAAPQPGDLVFDLYAGVGLFSAFLAQAGARVVAVEGDPWAGEDFAHNLDRFEGVELYQSSVELALPALDHRPAGVIVDPPRAGLSPQVVDALLANPARRLVYVSCDPATLARDAKRLLKGGYRMDRVVPVDLFPQTYHIETVSSWTLESLAATQGRATMDR